MEINSTLSRHFYATGTEGGKPILFAFQSKSDRDDFVMWNKVYAPWAKISSKDAYKQHKKATFFDT